MTMAREAGPPARLLPIDRFIALLGGIPDSPKQHDYFVRKRRQVVTVGWGLGPEKHVTGQIAIEVVVDARGGCGDQRWNVKVGRELLPNLVGVNVDRIRHIA